jgi:Fic family protein
MYQPKYVISNIILRNIGSIEASKEVIENAPLVPFYEKKFQSEALLKTVHHGTHIEGNDLNMDQTMRVLEGEEVIARDRDIQEVINYRNVMTLLDELAAKRGGYDKESLLDIHKETVTKIIPEEKVGKFRQTQVIIKEEETGEIILEPPPFVEVPYLLDDFFEWLNSQPASEIHPILRAGLSHYILVSIHPFVEGNGRTVRAFATLILLREDYGIHKFFSLEEHFDADPAAYYEAFAQVDRQSKNLADRDVTPWLEYFTEVVAIELNKIKERVRKISIDSRFKGKIGEQVALTERQMRLVEYMSENGPSVMQDIKSVLPMVSEDTVLRDLNDLMDKGIIKKEGRTKASKYLITASRN